jgi:hypothetical protein
MGFIYTSEGTRRILDTLNTAFDGPGAGKGLQYIRDQVDASFAGDKKLYNMISGAKWRRGHLATTLQLLPFDQGAGGIDPSHTARWAFFLKTVVGGKFDDLCKALSEAILKKAAVNIVRIAFAHVEKSGSPNLVIYDAPLTSDVNGPYVRYITLFTRALVAGERDQFDPPDADDGNPLTGAPWRKP